MNNTIISPENNENIDPKTLKKQRKEDFLEKIWETVEKEFDRLFSDDMSRSEKNKEWTRIILTNTFILTPKVVVLALLGFTRGIIPIRILLKVLSTYFIMMPENSETDNKIIQQINSKTGMEFLLKNRPQYLKAIRTISQEELSSQLSWLKNSVIDIRKKVIRV